MNFKKTLLFSWLLAINFTTIPYSYTFSANSEKNYTDQFKDFMSNYEHDSFMFTASLTSFVSLLLGLAYLGDRYGAEKKNVDIDYPHAQTWYNNLCEKYPLAHLEQKKLLQTHGESTCLFYNIYLSRDSLRQINKLYEKQLDLEPLTDDEIAIMAQEEFMVVSYAGSIEHNCFMNKQLIMQPSILAAFTVIYPLLKTYHPITEVYDVASCARGAEQFYTDVTLLSIAALILTLSESACITTYQKNLTYSFACQHADDACLQGALSFCLDHKNTHEHLLKLITAEIAQREQNNLVTE
ncbi:MAG: hypothetical protein Q8Q60_00335 [Candidatus Chromulinivorax sp.]|nr:hypothetical protein [Candidatus Chromulinivorax sp.]